MVKGEAAEHKHLLALTRTCKEIRAQIGGTFYKNNRFVLKGPASINGYYNKLFCHGIIEWIALLGPHNDTFLRKITVDLGDWHDAYDPGFLIRSLMWTRYFVIEFTKVRPKLLVGLVPQTTILETWQGKSFLDFGNYDLAELRTVAKARINGYMKEVQSHADAESDRCQDCLEDLQHMQRLINEVFDSLEQNPKWNIFERLDRLFPLRY